MLMRHLEKMVIKLTLMRIFLTSLREKKYVPLFYQ